MDKSQLFEFAQEIFPFNRSITGNGVRQTLAAVKKRVPQLKTLRFASGHEVFDWIIPPEWDCQDAYLEHIESGDRFAEFSKHNLHVVGYSVPVDTTMSLSDLRQHLHYDENDPEAIPYVTSYYERTWGFCMSQRQYEALPQGEYRVRIDSTLEDGEMLLGELLLPGELPDEIFFSTYICHPSMANNEVSGPAVLTALMDFVTRAYPKPRFSYRFVLVPETIGSIAYLSKNLKKLQGRVFAGFNLSCVGDERAFSIVQTPSGSTVSDQALRAALIGRENVRTYSFLERGSDERQYCAPGVNLPVAGFCRTKYGEFPEYHTSADNFDVVTAEGLMGSFDLLKLVVAAFETGIYPQSNTLCEPQLSSRGLYPTTSKKNAYEGTKVMMDLLAFANGEFSIFELAELAGYELEAIVRQLEQLISHGLITGNALPTKPPKANFAE